MKKNIQLPNEVKQFLDQALMGIMIVDQHASVLYYNDKLKDYFYDVANDDQQNYGNIFNCDVVFDTTRVCGLSKICNNCDLRKSLLKVVESNEAVEKVHYKRVYVLHGGCIPEAKIPKHIFIIPRY